MILPYEITKIWVSKVKQKTQRMYGKQKISQLFLKSRKVSIKMRGASGVGEGAWVNGIVSSCKNACHIQKNF